MLKRFTPLAAMLALSMPAFAEPVNDDMSIWISNTFQTNRGIDLERKNLAVEKLNENGNAIGGSGSGRHG